MVEQIDHSGRTELVERHLQLHFEAACAHGAGAPEADRSAAGEEAERLLSGRNLVVSARLLVSVPAQGEPQTKSPPNRSGLTRRASSDRRTKGSIDNLDNLLIAGIHKSDSVVVVNNESSATKSLFSIHLDDCNTIVAVQSVTALRSPVRFSFLISRALSDSDVQNVSRRAHHERAQPELEYAIHAVQVSRDATRENQQRRVPLMKTVGDADQCLWTGTRHESVFPAACEPLRPVKLIVLINKLIFRFSIIFFALIGLSSPTAGPTTFTRSPARSAKSSNRSAARTFPTSFVCRSRRAPCSRPPCWTRCSTRAS